LASSAVGRSGNRKENPMNTIAFNVVKPFKPIIKTKTKTKSRHYTKRLRRQTITAVATGGVALLLTALSLSHLSAGVEIVTGCEAWEGWAMAGVIDLGFVALELSLVMAATDSLQKMIGRWAHPAIKGMLAGIAAMNAFAFAAHATGYMIAPAVVLGLAIPAFLYALTRVGAALYMDCDNRK
jgi:hypothetical protein